MNKDDLKKIKYDELKNIAKDMDITISKSKDKLIDSMIKCFEEYQKYKKNKIDKYEKIKQLGEKGKEGVTYLVKTSKGKEYAMKTFKKNKSSEKLKENILTVTGEQAKQNEKIEYLHKGISTRNFVRTFPLAEHIEVRGATIRNGILSIALEHIIPEDMKPKTIAITYAN